MSNEIIKPASMKKQIAFALAAFCTMFGMYALWEITFPPSMTAYCAYLIEKYPVEDFSHINAHVREETMKCLYVKWRYNQRAWKVNEDYIPRYKE
jgi:hypothetical protein